MINNKSMGNPIDVVKGLLNAGSDFALTGTQIRAITGAMQRSGSIEKNADLSMLNGLNSMIKSGDKLEINFKEKVSLNIEGVKITIEKKVTMNVKGSDDHISISKLQGISAYGIGMRGVDIYDNHAMVYGPGFFKKSVDF